MKDLIEELKTLPTFYLQLEEDTPKILERKVEYAHAIKHAVQVVESYKFWKPKEGAPQDIEVCLIRFQHDPIPTLACRKDGIWFSLKNGWVTHDDIDSKTKIGQAESAYITHYMEIPR